MILTLLQHKWKEVFRSPALSQHLVQTIFLGLFFLYLALSLLFLGFVGGKILQEQYPDADIYSMVGGGIVYYFLFDLIIRVILQKFPFLNIKKYLHLSVRKSSIIHYLLFSSATSFFNVFPFFGLIPFILSNRVDMSSKGIIFPFIIAFVGWVLLNNYLSFFLDRVNRKNSIIPYVIIGGLCSLLYLDFNAYITLKPIFDQLFAFLYSSIFIGFIPLVGAAIAYMINYRFLHSNLYIEDLVEQNVAEAQNFNLGFLDRFGEAGKLMNLEMKLIWRNKRSKVFLLLSFLMLLYPMIFLGDDAMRLIGLELFIGIFVTGMFALNYGQLMLSWNSTHFDLLATRKIAMADIFQAKYYLLTFSCLILYLLSLVYGFISLRMIWVMTISFLFNIGVSIFLYMFLAAHNSKRIDPGKGAIMNYEGIGLAHFLIIIPIIFLPVLIRWTFAHFGYPAMGEAAIGFVGLLGFIFHKRIINLATNYFKSNRYAIMAAFRKKS